ncbi:hypothetical protein QYE76_028490 [Lolium multiflorum]|uniref:Uncharacterized protein n=1 Tax=Lolium multiflorum TaxID=4521 RepID=A0AAD8VEL9_LOLMU|nr:hypothetical protein QYE76_028490 [Lolium multiflorum]
MATSASSVNDRRRSAHDGAADLRPPGKNYWALSTRLELLDTMVVVSSRVAHRSFAGKHTRNLTVKLMVWSIEAGMVGDELSLAIPGDLLRKGNSKFPSPRPSLDASFLLEVQRAVALLLDSLLSARVLSINGVVKSSETSVTVVGSDSTTGTMVLPASSTRTVVLPASSPGSPASPTSVLRVAPLTAIIPLGSPDLSAPTVNAQPSLIASKPAMVWKPELSEFVQNRFHVGAGFTGVAPHYTPPPTTFTCFLAPTGVCFNMGFKEQQMKKVAADVLAFAGVHVTTLQLYNHIRNWRTKWSVIMKMKSDRILDWSEDGCCFYGGDEGAADEYITRYPKHRQYVGTPITNYAQMKTIFTPRFVCKAQLFQPNLLVRAIDFIADNEAEYAVYRKLQPPERRSWLRTWLRNQFPA